MGSACCAGTKEQVAREEPKRPEPLVQMNSYEAELDTALRDMAQLTSQTTVLAVQTIALVHAVSENVTRLTSVSTAISQYETGKSNPPKTDYFKSKQGEIEDLIEDLETHLKHFQAEMTQHLTELKEKAAYAEKIMVRLRWEIGFLKSNSALTPCDRDKVANLEVGLLTPEQELTRANSDLRSLPNPDFFKTVPNLESQLRDYLRLATEQEGFDEGGNSEVTSSGQVEPTVVSVPVEEGAVSNEETQDSRFEDIWNESAEFEVILQENLLRKFLSKHPTLETPVFDSAEVLNLFAQLLISKEKSDLSTTSQSLSWDVFIIQFFISETQGVERLFGFLQGVKNTAQSGIAAGVLLARILGVFHPRPYPKFVSLFASRIDSILSEFAAKLVTKKEATTKKTQTAEELQIQCFTGGKIPLKDALDLTYQLFDGYPQSGIDLVAFLRPETVEIVDFGYFCIFHMMQTHHIDGLALQKALAGGVQTLSKEGFVTGIKEHMGIWVTKEAAEAVFDSIDIEKTGGIGRLLFNKALNLKRYYEVKDTETYTITKYSFLEKALDAVWTRRRQVIIDIYSIFVKHSNSLGRVTYAQAQEILAESGSLIAAETVLSHYKAVQGNVEDLTLIDLVKVIEDYGVLGDKGLILG